VLPGELPQEPRPVVVITLKNRMLNPAVELFLNFARDVAASMAPTKTRAKT